MSCIFLLLLLLLFLIYLFIFPLSSPQWKVFVVFFFLGFYFLKIYTAYKEKVTTPFSVTLLAKSSVQNKFPILITA